MFVAYDKNCKVWILEPDAIVFVEVTPKERKEIEDDEDRIWKSPAEFLSSTLNRQKFEVNEDGSIFYYNAIRK